MKGRVERDKVRGRDGRGREMERDGAREIERERGGGRYLQ